MFRHFLLFSFLVILANCSYEGIDVSVWQGPDIDFNRVKNAGINFVIIRAGCGSDVDTYFEDNYRKAKDAGLNVGAYWFAHAMSLDESSQEANNMLSVTSDKQFEYPLFYDIEKQEIFDQGVDFVSGISANFCTILQNSGKACGLYSSKSFLENYFNYDVLHTYTIWVAQYYSECTYDGPYMIWQKSSTGQVDGISGDVDLDTSYYDYATYMKENHLNGF